MTFIDWAIVASLMIFITYAANTTKKYTRGVVDFLAANRCAGRYLLGTAENAASLGAVSVIVGFELYMKTGLTQDFWYSLFLPISMVMTLTGFIYYRFRATRALTLAQFFEMRYSRKFRIFSGILAWVSGVINFGLFPCIGARFFVNFCGFPNYIVPVGPLDINLTLAATMLILISLTLYFTFMGGQISVLVTEFWQGIFTAGVFFALVLFFWVKFPWSQIGESLILASKPGCSLVNPLDIGGKEDFNFSFFAIMIFFMVYNRMAWQGNQAYNCSATTPHEAKMSKIVGSLRGGVIYLGLTLIPLGAITVLNHPSYADTAATVNLQLQNAYSSDETLKYQMLVPTVLKNILPVGLFGCFVAAMLAFFICSCSTYMHSWGCIFVQDVLCVVRKRPLSPEKHLLALRLSIVFVAVFSFFFGLIFPLKEYIWMFLTITGAIFLGGAGAVLIGGLYWRRGTTLAAWSALIVGAVLSVGVIVIRAIWGNIPFLVERFGSKFPYNSLIMSFAASIIAIAVYVVVSLLSKNSNIDMDKLLHRGEYSIEEEERELKVRGAINQPVAWYWRMIGVNSHEFSKIDKALFMYTVLMNSWGIGSFCVLLTLGLLGRMQDNDWTFWAFVGLTIWLIVSYIGAIWVGICGLFDLRDLYRRLKMAKRDIFDDGRVTIDHQASEETDEELSCRVKTDLAQKVSG
jgi:SSS family solute:Na+ symporter